MFGDIAFVEFVRWACAPALDRMKKWPSRVIARIAPPKITDKDINDLIESVKQTESVPWPILLERNAESYALQEFYDKFICDYGEFDCPVSLSQPFGFGEAKDVLRTMLEEAIGQEPSEKMFLRTYERFLVSRRLYSIQYCKNPSWH